MDVIPCSPRPGVHVGRVADGVRFGFVGSHQIAGWEAVVREFVLEYDPPTAGVGWEIAGQEVGGSPSTVPRWHPEARDGGV